MFKWLKRKLGLTFEPEKYPLLTAWQRERGTSSYHSGETFNTKNPGQYQTPERGNKDEKAA